MSYVKVYDSLLRSSVIEEDVPTRWLWIVMLLCCDEHGNVTATVPALARIANMPEADARGALDKLMEPDPNSTTPDEDGRRVTSESPNVWHLTNYLRYRNMKDPKLVREQTRLRVRAHRERQRDCNAVTQTVTEGNAPLRQVAEAVAVAVAEDGEETKTREAADAAASPRRFAAPSEAEVTTHCREKGYTFSPAAFCAYYESKGWKVGNAPMKSWQAACVTWQQREPTKDVKRDPASNFPRTKDERRADGYVWRVRLDDAGNVVSERRRDEVPRVVTEAAP